MKLRLYILLFSLFLFPLLGVAQKFGAGVDAMYNFQTESIGTGARVKVYLTKRLSVVPQFSYYFAFNKIKEYYVGTAIECKYLKMDNFNLYVLAHGGYNAWLNYQNSAYEGAKKNNWNLEGGLGASANWCLRPFIEYRYNVKFRETHLRLGIMYIFGCKIGKGRFPVYDSQ